MIQIFKFSSKIVHTKTEEVIVCFFDL